MGLGASIFNYIGAISRWIYGSIWCSIFKKKRFSFKEYLNGPNNSDDWFDMTGHVFVNKVVGFIISMIICGLLAFLT